LHSVALGFGAALEQETAIVLGFRALDVEGNTEGSGVELIEDLLEFLSGDEIDFAAAAGGDEEENAPENDVELFEEGDHGVEVGKIVARDGGVDLNGQTDFAGPADGLESPVEGTGDAAESIVDGGGGTVETDGEAGETTFLEADDGFAGEERSRTGRERDADAVVGGVLDEFEDVGPFKGSPPVSTKTGARRAATSSMRLLACSVLSSRALRRGWAQARQWTQARSQA